jgi:hypothetical protein
MFEQFVDNLNLNPPIFNLEFYSARDLVIQYRRKALILFKLILLQKKVYSDYFIDLLINSSLIGIIYVNTN